MNLNLSVRRNAVMMAFKRVLSCVVTPVDTWLTPVGYKINHLRAGHARLIHLARLPSLHQPQLQLLIERPDKKVNFLIQKKIPRYLKFKLFSN